MYSCRVKTRAQRMRTRGRLNCVEQWLRKWRENDIDIMVCLYLLVVKSLPLQWSNEAALFYLLLHLISRLALPDGAGS